MPAATTAPSEITSGPVIITVGPDGGDVRGNDSAALQAAADEVARRAPGGGGLLLIKAGAYTMFDSLHIRCPMTVRGEGARTILLKCPQFKTTLVEDFDLSEYEAAVADSSGLRVGMGVSILDHHNSQGWNVTVRTILAINGQRIRLNGRPERDYTATNGAIMRNAFSLISGRCVEGVTIENLVVDGNLEQNRDCELDGCRGGGIYLHDVRRCTVRGVIARNVNGDGISWQTTEDVLVEDCEAYGNTVKGLHPGTGSPRTTVRNCRAHHNGWHGLFICWGVRHSRFENNICDDNARYGISIGHKDTDNLIADSTMRRNGVAGIEFRNEPAASAAHRVALCRNVIEDNGSPETPGIGVKIDGGTEGTLLEANTIRDTRPAGQRTQAVAVWVGPKAQPPTIVPGNTIDGEIVRLTE